MSAVVVESPENVPAAATEGVSGLPTVSADALHELLIEMHATANTARRRFMDALRALDEGRLYLKLGYPSIAAYAEAMFRFRKSQTYEYLRVSRAFERLPAIAAAYECGELSLSLAGELARVAVAESEEEWLELARERRPGVVRAEVRDALRNKRERPRRDGGFGLPGLPVKIVLEFSPEDHAIVEQALAMTAEEMAAGLDGERPSQEQVLVYLTSRRLEEQTVQAEGDEENGAAPKSSPPYTVVFTRCTDCRRTAVETSEGRVEVPPESLARFEGSAECVEIDTEAKAQADSGASENERPGTELDPPIGRDRPNTSRIRRLVRARAGGRCENPYCRFPTRGAGHAHHIVYRSQGGATKLSNETHLCPRCHSLVHVGCLSVSGDAVRGLEWRSRGLDAARRVREELERSRSLPQVLAVVRHGRGSPGAGSGIPENRNDPDHVPSAHPHDARALQKHPEHSR